MNTLPADLFKELDQIQDQINNEQFDRLNDLILSELYNDSLIVGYDINSDINFWNQIFFKYRITSRFINDNVIYFDRDGRQKINRQLLEEMKREYVKRYGK